MAQQQGVARPWSLQQGGREGQVAALSSCKWGRPRVIQEMVTKARNYNRLRRKGLASCVAWAISLGLSFSFSVCGERTELPESWAPL